MIDINYELVQERYELAITRIREIANETETAKQYASYFKEAAAFLVKIDKVYGMAANGSLFSMPVAKKEVLNASLYEELFLENYKKSYCNPTYAVEVLGGEYGTFLAALRAELRSLVAYAYEKMYITWLSVWNSFWKFTDGLQWKKNRQLRNYRKALRLLFLIIRKILWKKL